MPAFTSKALFGWLSTNVRLVAKVSTARKPTPEEPSTSSVTELPALPSAPSEPAATTPDSTEIVRPAAPKVLAPVSSSVPAPDLIRP